MTMTDVWFTKSHTDRDGDWYTITKAIDGHMECVPHVYGYEDADCLVTKLRIRRTTL